MPDSIFAATARDLAALSAADRRAILAAFEPADRNRLRAAMRAGAAPSVRRAGDVEHSPWFASLVAAARDPQAGDGPTTAARAALLDTVQGAAGAGRLPGRSLLQAAGGLLAAGRTR